MWRRPALLALYLALVVVITWLVELSHWWETGHTTYQVEQCAGQGLRASCCTQDSWNVKSEYYEKKSIVKI